MRLLETTAVQEWFGNHFFKGLSLVALMGNKLAKQYALHFSYKECVLLQGATD